MIPPHRTTSRLTAKRTGHINACAGIWLLAAMLLPSTSALAWNAAGHRLVACIAWGQIDAREQSQLGQLLRAHPDYPHWIRPDDDTDRTAFIESSTWADEIRYDPRFYDAGIDEVTAPLPGFPDTERHRDWHYVNRPINARQLSGQAPGHIEEQLVALTRILASTHRSLSEQSVALPWLIHLVGDAHQPLHVGVRLDRKGKWDKWGDGERIINPYNPRKRRSTLHAFWDDLPGPSWLRRQPLTETCQALAALYPRPARSAPAQWIEESWQIAKISGYPPGAENIPVISAEFQQTASEIARHRIAEAGYRLADELHSALSGTRAPD